MEQGDRPARSACDGVTLTWVLAKMNGRILRTARSGAAMIELVNVTQHYGVRPVLKQINLRIETGELVVIVGPNGMGKTTLLGVMGGALQPQHGHVTIDSQQRRRSADEELAIRKRAV